MLGLRIMSLLINSICFDKLFAVWLALLYVLHKLIYCTKQHREEKSDTISKHKHKQNNAWKVCCNILWKCNVFSYRTALFYSIKVKQEIISSRIYLKNYLWKFEFINISIFDQSFIMIRYIVLCIFIPCYHMSKWPSRYISKFCRQPYFEKENSLVFFSVCCLLVSGHVHFSSTRGRKIVC